MAALLCRRLLLADPTLSTAAASLPTPPMRFLSNRVAAAASLLTPPTHFLSLPTLHPHCPTSPRSMPSAASMSSGTSPLPSPATPSAASMSARTSLLPSPAVLNFGAPSARTPSSPSPAVLNFGALSARTPPSASPAVLNFGAPSARTPPSPSPAVLKPHLNFGALSAGPHGICGGALSAGPHGICGWKVKGRRAQPSLVLPQNRQNQSSSLLCQKRTFSSEQKVNSSRPPPIRQLVFRDDSQASEEVWVDLTEYLEHHSLVEDARQNHLNMEIEGFGLKARYNLSEDTGIPLFECLVLLALANNNRGYCVKRSFSKDNLLVCPRLKQLMFKSVISDDLEPGVSDFNRAASYAAAGRLMRELLKDYVGPDAISQLLAEPRDLISKLEHPSDERLIVYHPTFLSMDGRLWYYEKLYRLVFKVFPSQSNKFRKQSNAAVSGLAYTDGNLLVFDIIDSHPLLTHIERGAPDETERPEGRSDKHKKKNLGKKVVALHRHTIEHAFDKGAMHVPSNQASRKILWPYSIHQVVDFLKSVMPLHLLKSQEIFLSSELWDYLNIDSFWSRDLTWIGGVPAPSKEEENAIKMVESYGRRRLSARKFDQ